MDLSKNGNLCPPSRRHFWFVVVVCSLIFCQFLATGCERKSTKNVDNCVLDNSHTNTAVDAKTIEWKVSPQFYNMEEGAYETTPCFIIAKTKKAFDLWESIPQAKLKFVYSGFIGSKATNPVINIWFDGTNIWGHKDWSSTPGVAGTGGYSGVIPDDFQEGHVHLNLSASNPYLYSGITLKTMIHEIGHALGLPHMATNASIMSCGTAAWSDFEVLGFGNQDVANMIDLWGDDSDKMSISGKIVASQSALSTQVLFFVFAVDIVKGVTFSALSNALDQTYKINIYKDQVTKGQISGQFRVFAKGYDFSSATKLMEISPSWWIANGVSTNNPTAGAVITLTDSNSERSDVDISLIEEPPAVNLFWGGDENVYTTPGYVQAMRSFISPGETIAAGLSYLRGTPSAILPYGTSPDYGFSALVRKYADADYWLTNITVNSNAVSGERLIMLTGSGNTQAGLAGLQVVKSVKPSCLGESGSANMIDQLKGNANLNLLNPLYWIQ